MQKNVISSVRPAIDLHPDFDLGQHGARDGAPLGERLTAEETGAATAEYAIATLAAVGFAGLLVVVLRSEQVRGLLAGIIETALTVAG